MNDPARPPNLEHVVSDGENTPSPWGNHPFSTVSKGDRHGDRLVRRTGHHAHRGGHRRAQRAEQHATVRRVPVQQGEFRQQHRRHPGLVERPRQPAGDRERAGHHRRPGARGDPLRVRRRRQLHLRGGRPGPGRCGGHGLHLQCATSTRRRRPQQRATAGQRSATGLQTADPVLLRSGRTLVHHHGRVRRRTVHLRPVRRILRERDRGQQDQRPDRPDPGASARPPRCSGSTRPKAAHTRRNWRATAASRSGSTRTASRTHSPRH